MPRLLRRVESIVPRRAHDYGGKARNLAALARAGFPVPAAWAMSGTVCRDFLHAVLDPDEHVAALLSAPASQLDTRRLEAIADRVRRAALPEPLARELRRTLAELARIGGHPLVVRSSSTREDQEAGSAAGLHESVLNVRGFDELSQAVRSCWASLYQPRALAYLRTVAGAPDASMGVVVQVLVPATASGVLFTVNPLTGDTGEMLINCAWGLGVSVAGGRVSPDTFRVDKSSGALRDRVVGDKRVRVVTDPAGGVREEPVPEAEQGLSSLTESELADLVALGVRIEAQFGTPQDVEWSLVGGTLYVLQTRPVSAVVPSVTSRSLRRPEVDRSRIVWSNVNVGEALPGVATPLTWSVLSSFSELGFRRAFGSLGCTVPRGAELVGSFRGRIYLNLSELMAILSQVPGLRPRTLLALGGGGEVERLEAEVERRGSTGFFLRLPATIARFMRENYRIGHRVTELEARFEAGRVRQRSIDLRLLAPSGLDHALRDAERLLDSAGSVMLTCYGNLLASVVLLRGVLRLVAGGRSAAIERGLLAGLADVESAAPGLALWHIAEMARAEEGVRRLLLERDPWSLGVSRLPVGPTRRALERFMTAYGFRGVREAELASPRWREDPTLLFAALRAHLRGQDGRERPVDVERRQRRLRDEAAAELDAALPPPARAAARHLLALVQRFMRLRERLRARVTEVLGHFRHVALDASSRLEAHESGVGSDAAFFLTVDELHALLGGEMSSVGTLVRQRRQQFRRDCALPDPPGTFVGYPPEVPPPPPHLRSLVGLAASAGRAEGIARVLTSPAQAAELQIGEILVAPYADVGWSPLFTLVGAVVTDLGGPLSHASIVAREYGVPSVVNVKIGTRLIHSGDRVFVDGDAGIVRIVESAARPAADA